MLFCVVAVFCDAAWGYRGSGCDVGVAGPRSAGSCVTALVAVFTLPRSCGCWQRPRSPCRSAGVAEGGGGAHQPESTDVRRPGRWAVPFTSALLLAVTAVVPCLASTGTTGSALPARFRQADASPPGARLVLFRRSASWLCPLRRWSSRSSRRRLPCSRRPTSRWRRSLTTSRR